MSLVVILLFSCAAPQVTAPAPPTPAVAPTAEAPTAEAPVPVPVHMAERLAHAIATRDAVVRGDVEGARAGFGWLAEDQVADGLPEASLPWLEGVRAAARAGQQAETAQDQAMALGELANSCGGCHQSLETGPLFAELPAPDAGDGLALHMAQHAWANDRMWAALVEPSSAAWQRSLRVLGEDAVAAAEIPEWGLPEGAEALDAQVHRLAHAALADDNPDTRADLYGQIVGQCASCHRLSRGAP